MHRHLCVSCLNDIADRQYALSFALMRIAEEVETKSLWKISPFDLRGMAWSLLLVWEQEKVVLMSSLHANSRA